MVVVLGFGGRSLDPINPPINDVLATFASAAAPRPVTPAPIPAPINPGARGPNIAKAGPIAIAGMVTPITTGAGPGAGSGAGEGELVEEGRRRVRKKEPII